VKKEEPKEEVKGLDPRIQSAFAAGMSEAAGGDPTAAIARFKQAATNDPLTHWAHYNLGVLYERKGDLANAEREYLKALDLNAKLSYRAAENYSKLLVRTGRALQAEAELKRRINAAPEALGLRYALAWASTPRTSSTTRRWSARRS